MKSIRKFLKGPLRKIELGIKSRVAQSLQFFFRRINPPIFITFDSSISVDGTGAQLQRKATVMAVAKYFGFTYVPSQIRQVSIHPLDSFQSESDYKSFLNRINQFLKMDSNMDLNVNAPEVKLNSLTFSRLICEFLLQLFRKRARNLIICEPYSVSEFCPGIMDDLQLQAHEYIDSSRAKDIFDIVIHYRQGVGGFALYPGQNIPREIPLELFALRVAKIVMNLPENLVTQITVVTDAPAIETVFSPPANQLALWEGTPGFSNGVMTIKPAKFDVLDKFSKLPVKVLRGGNPLDTILIMASADVLLTGKSSLSYMGGLLNRNGKVYYPKDFWHRPLKTWERL